MAMQRKDRVAEFRKTVRRPVGQAAGATWEGLEERRMLSISLASGALVVTGTGGADTISLDLQSGQIHVAMNAEEQSFDPNQVTSIVVNAGAGDDLITLGDGLIGATVNAEDGDDTLVSGTRPDNAGIVIGDDTLAGGLGNDRYVFHDNWGNDVVDENVGEGNDTMDFSAATADLVFTIGALDVHDVSNTVIHGGQEVENLTGGSGDDVFFFNDGATLAGTIDGGGGVNTLVYTNYTTGVTVDLGQHTATGTGGVTQIQNVVGGAGNDTLTGDAGANSLDGGPGSNQLNGGGGADTFPRSGSDPTAVNTITQPAGTTVPLDLSGMTTPLVFNIGATNVTVSSGGTVIATAPTTGSLKGGSANDQFVFANGATYTGTVDGGGGVNTLDYSAYTTPVKVKLGVSATGTAGTSNIANILGGAANDVLVGDAGKNVIKGNGGADKLYGMAGNDQLRGGNGNDLLYGGVGNDVEYGDAGNDKVRGDAGNDKVYGGTGNDILTGGAGKDLLSGDTGNDAIYARDKAKDTVRGGTGANKAQLDAIDARSLIQTLLK